MHVACHVELRPYQTEALTRLRRSYRDGHRRLLLVAPTGSGKTVLAGALIRGAMARGTRVLYVAHRTELVDQPLRLLRSMGLPCGRIQSGHPEDRDAPIQVASIQTLAHRELPPAGLAIVDEAHRAVTGSYDVLAHYPVHLGLTATPWRLLPPRDLPRERRGELIRQRVEQRRVTWSRERKDALYQQLLATAAARGYRRGWAYVQYRLRVGEAP